MRDRSGTRASVGGGREGPPLACRARRINGGPCGTARSGRSAVRWELRGPPAPGPCGRSGDGERSVRGAGPGGVPVHGGTSLKRRVLGTQSGSRENRLGGSGRVAPCRRWGGDPACPSHRPPSQRHKVHARWHPFQRKMEKISGTAPGGRRARFRRCSKVRVHVCSSRMNPAPNAGPRFTCDTHHPSTRLHTLMFCTPGPVCHRRPVGAGDATDGIRSVEARAPRHRARLHSDYFVRQVV